MQTLNPVRILFTAVEVAQAANVRTGDLRYFEPADFGSPGHWFMQDGNPVYTEKGLERLAKGFEMLGHVAAAHSLRVLLKQTQETPSKSYWFNKGPMA